MTLGDALIKEYHLKSSVDYKLYMEYTELLEGDPDSKSLFNLKESFAVIVEPVIKELHDIFIMMGTFVNNDPTCEGNFMYSCDQRRCNWLVRAGLRAITQDEIDYHYQKGNSRRTKKEMEVEIETIEYSFPIWD